MKSVLRDASPLLASRSPIFKHDTCYQHKPIDESDSWFYLGKIKCITFKNKINKTESVYTTLFYSDLFGDYEFTDCADNKIDQFEVGICYKYNPKDSDSMPILGTVKIVIFESEETLLPFPEILVTEIVEECTCQIQIQRQRPGGKRSNRSKKRRRSNKRKSIRHK